MKAFLHDDRGLAETYHRASELQFERGRRLVERLGPIDGARVLDVGCGTGRLTQWIAERAGPHGAVVGIDPSEQRIRLARSTGGGARFEVGRAEDLRAFEDASFEVVCMSSVLHWVEDKGRALAEARRVLRPGGVLGVSTVAQELERHGTIRQTIESVLARAPWASRVDGTQLSFAKPGLTTTGLISLVQDCGLELVELHVQRDTHLHASGEELVAFMEASAFGTFLQPIPEDLRPRLRADLVAAFEAQRGPAGIPLHGSSVLFTARRT